MPITLTGSAQTIPLGEGYALTAPGVRGVASLSPSSPTMVRSRSGGRHDGLGAVDEALRAQYVTEVKRIDLSVQASTHPTGGPATRGGQAGGYVELQTPDPGDAFGQLVLSVDDAGALRWHLPEARAEQGAATTRGRGATTRFLIPATVIPDDPRTTPAASRSILGAATRRLLKVLVYPITDPVIGAISDMFAVRWEKENRPYRLRAFTPRDYSLADMGKLDMASVAAMAAQGPVLLFIHGTFSSAHGGFGGLPSDTMQQLHDRYGGRVLALDHPTLGDTPADNVRWLLGQLPDSPVQFDVICHSRGGLVSRVLVEQVSGFGLDTSRVKVGQVAFVGVPNNGTVLADPDHLVAMIDRLTTALMLFPTGPVTETIEAMLTVLKMIGHGALGGLKGIAGMRPGGDFLKALNASSAASTKYFAVTSNYEPTDRGLRGLVAGLGDGVADNIFDHALNDLVVPTDGVWDSNGATAFPLTADRLLKLAPGDGVMHTGYFPHPAVSAKLLQWMQA